MERKLTPVLSDDEDFFQQAQTIEVVAPEALLTGNNKDAYRVCKGSVLIYLVPVKKGMPNRRKFIATMTEGEIFPALYYCDAEYIRWQFLVIPTSGSVTLQQIADGATIPLRENFIHNAQIPGYEVEGFESSLREHYITGDIAEQNFIVTSEENRDELASKSAFAIIRIMSDGAANVDSDGSNTLYAVLTQLCVKAGITLCSGKRITECCGSKPSIVDIGRLSNFTCRKITLDADWMKWDCGYIVTFMDDAPVGIYRGKKGKYYLCNGRDEQILTPEMANGLSMRGFVIGRALPKTKLTRKQIFAFCKKSIPTSSIYGVLLLGLMGTLIGILQPTLNQKIYDDYIALGDYGMVLQMCMLIGTFMVGNVFFTMVKKLTEYTISCRVNYDFQNALYLRIFQLPESFFSKFNSADLGQRLMKAGPAVHQVTNMIVGTGFATVFSLFYLWRMIKYSGKLTIWALLMSLVFSLLLLLLESFSLKYEKLEAEANGDAAAKLFQFLNGIDKIRMAGAEERVLLEYMIPYTKEQHYNIKENRISAFSAVLQDSATYLFAMVLYLVIIKKNQTISVGSFMAFNAAFGTFSAALLQLVKSGLAIYRLKPTFDRLQPVFEEVPEDGEEKQIVQKLSGDVSVEHLTFAYTKDGADILHDVSLHIKPGEYVAIVGPSGCGKSTLLKLLLGFEKPKAGKIQYGGINMDNLDVHSLRRNLGVVLQDGKLIEGSILENVTITAPETPLKKVQEIIEAVGLKDDIAQMPMGLQTVLNETGGTISGGQQQRILIARSIMNQPKILYFDEATSALDNNTQAMVCKSLDKMNVTRIVIAHRLTTVKNCDRILVFNGGRIQEEGNYESLMAQKGMFYQMAKRQIAEES